MNVQEEITRLKEEKNAIILVHNYQRPKVQDVADYLGDSLGLSREASNTNADMIVFCGVTFMAETAKILSPDKTVLLPRKEAGCPMADMVSSEEVIALREKYPNAKVVSYVNTNADVKAVTDVCCTSSNAVEVVRNIEADRVIFIPDRNLASYVKRFVNKEIIPWDGYCYVHERITKDEVLKAKEKYPDAIVLVHPECNPPVIDIADEVLSTQGMVDFVGESDNKRFLIGTEEGILYRLKKENPDKEFYPAGTPKICQDMKRTTLDDVYLALKDEQYSIEIPNEIISSAKRALEAMLQYV
ncbi:quinolinate synthase NadA [candidate division WOR-3 bacterium]|nr:quinolinate synthase NadA [candidate division WOR-3 bacterium]